LWRPEHPSAPKIFDAATTTLSAKGQVVIPEAIRERLGLKTGAQFVVVADRDVVTLKVLEPPAVSEFKITYDRALWNEPASLRFIDAHAHVAIVGPVGVGKTFLTHALGWIACRRGASALCVAADKMLKALRPTRLDHTYEQELQPRHLRDPQRAAPLGIDHRHLESGPRRVARDFRRSTAYAVRQRPLRQERLRPGHRR
jgi:AbrB family looped-hinge helix DNA binding protein